MSSPFHIGEQRIQSAMGVREQIEPWAQRVIRPYMPEQHQAFYRDLPFIVAAASDANGRPWITLLDGEPGYIYAPDANKLSIASLPPEGDALHDCFYTEAAIGLLGIDLAARRRNRMNGHIVAADPSAIHVEVDQSFGNCPQHISPRHWYQEPNPKPIKATSNSRLTSEQMQWISRADTFFIASGYTGEVADSSVGMDASHRGGEPGFVHVTSPTHLVWPDYSGNNHFNTLGNLIMNPLVGMTFVDFENGHLLQLTGRAIIDWNSDQVASMPEARRLVHVEIDEVIAVSHRLRTRWLTNRTPPLRLTIKDKRVETPEVTSLYLQSDDSSPLPDFEPGQHLPIQIHTAGQHITRTYSLSAAANTSTYRISVKREPQGAASNWLHDQLRRGDTLYAWPPAGDFYLARQAQSKQQREDTTPIVLISAGVGITPMVSMLQTLARTSTPVYFIHQAKNIAHYALKTEVDALINEAANTHLHISYSQPDASEQGDHVGHIGVEQLKQWIPKKCRVYLCGPAGFMHSIQGHLEKLGVDQTNVHTELFSG